MRQVNDNTLKDMLGRDYIGRNSQLESVMGFINSIDSKLSPVIAVDSPWGTGKTIFVKQLELINSSEDIQSPEIDVNTIEVFRRVNNVYYFNAWENDYIDDPLQALIFNLIKDIDTQGLQAKAMQKALKGLNVSAFIKNVTKDGIDFTAVLEPDAMIKDISEVLNRKERIHELLSAYIKDTGKRLVFIVDELDRCKPSFAVNLLEAIKHYFTDEDVIFIMAVDTSQLIHTVRKYYGEGFDAGAYLNRFFDYNISLKTPDRSRYLKSYLGVQDDSYWMRLVPKAIVEYFDMSMRETETYFRALNLLSGYMSRERHVRDEKMAIFTQFVFTPLALALKIHEPSESRSFMAGHNVTVLEDLVLQSGAVQDILQRYDDNKEDYTPERAATFAASLYNDLLLKKGDYELASAREEALEVTSLISRYATIAEIDAGGGDG